MARTTVRVKYPKGSGEKLLKLFEEIIEQHKKLGDASPLKNFAWLDMNEFEKQTAIAGKKRQESIEHRTESEVLMEEANNIIGTGVGQTNRSKGTLLFMMTTIRDLLLNHFKQQEEALSEFGFDVVIGKARLPKKKNKE